MSTMKAGRPRAALRDGVPGGRRGVPDPADLLRRVPQPFETGGRRVAVRRAPHGRRLRRRPQPPHPPAVRRLRTAMTVQRSVLVTGCSSGFGLETATLLATRGWRVFAGLRDPDKRGDLDASVAMAGAPDDALEVVQLDVTDAASIDRAAKQVLVATGGALDAVVHNAGVSSAGYLEDIPVEEYRRVLETNFFGVVQLTAAVVPAMRDRGSGRVVVISSTSAHLPMPL